jgi:DNA-binding CsgD family transcriptional regulator/GAF domain-containing protein
MASSETVFSIISAIYDAALDDELWHQAVEQVAAALGGTGSSIAVQDRVTHELQAVAFGSQLTMLEAYNPYWASICPTWPPTFSVPVGTLMIDRLFIGRRAIEKSEFYNDFLRPLDVNSAMAIKILHEPRSAGVLMVTRDHAQPEFESKDGALLKLLVPHMEKALRIRQRLSGEPRLALEALDRLNDGVIVLDAHARILVANASARHRLASGDGLFSCSDGLRTLSNDQTQTLRGMIGQAATRTFDPRDVAGDLIAIRRPTKRPLSVLVAPISTDGHALRMPGCAAILFIIDPEETPLTLPQHLISLYGLTRMEAKVAVSVLESENLVTVAEKLGIGHATVKTHIHNVFAKTNTQRQAELVRLILKSRISFRGD